MKFLFFKKVSWYVLSLSLINACYAESIDTFINLQFNDDQSNFNNSFIINSSNRELIYKNTINYGYFGKISIDGLNATEGYENRINLILNTHSKILNTIKEQQKELLNSEKNLVVKVANFDTREHLKKNDILIKNNEVIKDKKLLDLSSEVVALFESNSFELAYNKYVKLSRLYTAVIENQISIDYKKEIEQNLIKIRSTYFTDGLIKFFVPSLNVAFSTAAVEYNGRVLRHVTNLVNLKLSNNKTARNEFLAYVVFADVFRIKNLNFFLKNIENFNFKNIESVKKEIRINLINEFLKNNSELSSVFDSSKVQPEYTNEERLQIIQVIKFKIDQKIDFEKEFISNFILELLKDIYKI